MPRVFLVLALTCSVFAGAAGASFAEDTSITLVYVSHMADIDRPGGSGYAELMTLLEELRGRGGQVLLFHGGNVLGPSALSSYDKGAHMIGILNNLMPDVLALGRRDFMHKEDELLMRSMEAVFPIVCSNVYDPITLEAPGNTRKDYIFQGPVPLGFLALVSPEMQTTYIQRRLVTIGGPEILPTLSDELRAKGAQYLIASLDFMPEDLDEVLAESGVDMLFVSSAPETSFALRKGRALATHSGNENDVLVIFMKKAEGGLAISGQEVLNLKDYEPDLETLDLISRYSTLFSHLSHTQVGQVLTSLDTRTQILRSGENAMGNLVGDALRDYYGADVALVNSGGIRGNRVYEAGTTLKRGDLQSELPMHDVSCLIHVRGEVILAALEHGLSQVELVRGRFLQVSGLRYTYNPKAAPGSRVLNVSVGGKALDPNKIYSVSLPEYLSTHGDGFFMFPGECSSKASRPQQELVEIVRVYLGMHSPISPRLEGRIKAVEQ